MHPASSCALLVRVDLHGASTALQIGCEMGWRGAAAFCLGEGKHKKKKNVGPSLLPHMREFEKKRSGDIKETKYKSNTNGRSGSSKVARKGRRGVSNCQRSIIFFLLQEYMTADACMGTKLVSMRVFA